MWSPVLAREAARGLTVRTTVARRAGVKVFALLAVVGCSNAIPQLGDDAQTIDAPTAHGDVPGDGPTFRFQCSAPPPPGAAMPDLPALPAAGCPTLAPGVNVITTSGRTRQFILVTPTTALAAGEKLPVIFMWHWLGGTEVDFLEKGQVQAAADDQHFIGVLPASIGATVIGTSFDTDWPFDISQSQARMNEEFQFFDDMLACVEQQYAVNTSCVSSTGVSAGALFTDQLVQARSNMIASFMSMSGGVGATWIKPWNGSSHKLPGLVLWGGDGPPGMDGVKDILGCAGIGMDFAVASRALESGLTAGGQFFLECRHNCGHVEPPIDPYMDQSKYAGIWQFALDHPFWLQAGTSPWQKAIPPTMPAWCGIGANGDTPRSGGGCPPARVPCPS